MDNRNLDFAFLRHIGVVPETQQRIQAFYLPRFAGCRRVVDLACGEGDFVVLLEREGIEALGVDSDSACCKAARQRNLNVLCQDVFDFLRAADAGSFDGIFSAHLVEHLPYEKVMELFSLSWRALRPGGVIVVATPNVRGLYTHLESFYLHFGHVSFYHPELLCFLLSHSGFVDWEWGENPVTAAPLWGASPSLRPLSLERDLGTQWSGWPGRLLARLKRFLVTWLVLPYFDRLLPQIDQQFVQLDQTIKGLDRPVECYAVAIKPVDASASSEWEGAPRV